MRGQAAAGHERQRTESEGKRLEERLLTVTAGSGQSREFGGEMMAVAERGCEDATEWEQWS